MKEKLAALDILLLISNVFDPPIWQTSVLPNDCLVLNPVSDFVIDLCDLSVNPQRWRPSLQVGLQEAATEGDAAQHEDEQPGLSACLPCKFTNTHTLRSLFEPRFQSLISIPPSLLGLSWFYE